MLKTRNIIFLVFIIFGQQALSAQAIYKGSNALLRDAVEQNNCIWKSSEALKKEYKEVQPILESIDSVHFLFAAQIDGRMADLKFCLTQRRLPPLARNNSDDLYIFTNSSYLQPAVNDGGIVFIDVNLMKEMPPIHRGFVVHHEVLKEFYKNKGEIDRQNPLLQQVIMNLYSHYTETPVDQQTMQMIIEMAEFNSHYRLHIGNIKKEEVFSFIEGQGALLELERTRRNFESKNFNTYNIGIRGFKSRWQKVDEGFRGYKRQVISSEDRDGLEKLKEAGLIHDYEYYETSRNFLYDEFFAFAEGKTFIEVKAKLKSYQDVGYLDQGETDFFLRRVVASNHHRYTYRLTLELYDKYLTSLLVGDRLLKEIYNPSFNLTGEELEAFRQLAFKTEILKNSVLDSQVSVNNFRTYFPHTFPKVTFEAMCGYLIVDSLFYHKNSKNELNRANSLRRLFGFIPELKTKKCTSLEIIPTLLHFDEGSVWGQFILEYLHDPVLSQFDYKSKLFDYLKVIVVEEEADYTCKNKHCQPSSWDYKRNPHRYIKTVEKITYGTEGDKKFPDQSVQIQMAIFGLMSKSEKQRFKSMYFAYLDSIKQSDSKIVNEALRKVKKELKTRIKNYIKGTGQ